MGRAMHVRIALAVRYPGPMRAPSSACPAWLSLPLVAFALASGCASDAPNRKGGYTLGHDEMSRAVFLSASAMLLSHEVCTNGDARACYDADDATCVRVVGDAVLRAAPFDLKVMTGPEQQAWLEGPAPKVVARALATVGPGEPCRATSPIADFRVEVIDNQSKAGVPCVRMAGDPTPCTE